MNIVKMKINGYRICILDKNDTKMYVKRVKLTKTDNDSSLHIESVELCINPEDKILVIEDLAMATLVRKQLEVIQNSKVEMEPIYNFE